MNFPTPRFALALLLLALLLPPTYTLPYTLPNLDLDPYEKPFLSLSARQSTPETCAINSICFALDRSGSIGSFYPTELTFVEDVSIIIAKRASGTQFSAISFASSALVLSPPTSSINDFITALASGPSALGGTNMYAGLSACFANVENAPGNRVIVLLTDGKDASSPSALDLAPSVKAAGVAIVTVGIGPSVDEVYLRDVASAPELYIPSSFAMLPSNVVKAADTSCDAPDMAGAESTDGPDISFSPGPTDYVIPYTDEPLPYTPTPVPDPTRTPLPSATPVPSAPAGDACARAYQDCDFRFSGTPSVPTFAIAGPADTAFTPRIISTVRDEHLGVLNTNGIDVEFVHPDGTFTSVVKEPASQAFTPTVFKPFAIELTGGSGIGHEVFQGDQEQVARRRCVRVFFSEYQILVGRSAPFEVVDNVGPVRRDRKCVVFRTV